MITRTNLDQLNSLEWHSFTQINPFPNKPLFLRFCKASDLKTLREKEKLLVTSNFSFSYSVFYPLGELSTMFIKQIFVCKFFQHGRVKNFSFGKRVNYKAVESTEQDQTARMYRQILLYTLGKMNLLS